MKNKIFPNHIMIKILIGMILILLKPFIGFLFFFICFFEYFFILIFLSKIKFSKVKYFYIEINQSENFFRNSNILELWVKINYVEAFLKIYFFYNKKNNINFYNIFYFLLLRLIGAPVKMINHVYGIISQKGSLTEKFEKYYAEKIFRSKGLKIEILNKKIYLNNDFNIKKLLSKLIYQNNSFKLLQNTEIPKRYYNMAIELKLLTLDNTYKYSKFNDKTSLKKLIAFNEEKNIIHQNHYGISAINSGDSITTLHATSKIPPLSENQKDYSAIPSMVKKNAVNPGTIETKKIEKIIKMESSKIVNTLEIAHIVNQIPNDQKEDYDIPKEYKDLASETVEIYEKIFVSYNYDIEDKNIKKIIIDLSIGNYNQSFEKTTDEEIMEEIEKILS